MRHLQRQLVGLGRHLADEFVVAEDAVASHQRVMLHAFPPHLQPVGRSEVDGLGEVVSVIEAGVVGSREGYHELARVLVASEKRVTV